MGTNSRQNDDPVELAYAAFAAFADDGELDMGELNFLLGMALRDGELSEEEKNILAGLFNRVAEGDVSSKVWKRIQAVRRQHGI